MHSDHRRENYDGAATSEGPRAIRVIPAAGHRRASRPSRCVEFTKLVQLDAFESVVTRINDFWSTRATLPRQVYRS